MKAALTEFMRLYEDGKLGTDSGVIEAYNEAVRALPAPASSALPSNGAIAHTYGKLKAALAELLRLYDWRNELGRIERDFNHDKKQMTTWLNKYGREKHAAWDVARTTLDGAPDIDALLLHERIQTEAQARVAPNSATSPHKCCPHPAWCAKDGCAADKDDQPEGRDA